MSSEEEPCETCKHVTPSEERYLNLVNEYFNFIVRARHWGPEVNDMITKEWTELKIARELLKETDTIGLYVPPPPLVLNTTENDGTDSLEDIAEFIQNMALRRIFAMVLGCPDIKSKLTKFKERKEAKRKAVEGETKGEEDEEELKPITIAPGITMEFIEKPAGDVGPPVILCPCDGELNQSTASSEDPNKQAFWDPANEGRHDQVAELIRMCY